MRSCNHSKSSALIINQKHVACCVFGRPDYMLKNDKALLTYLLTAWSRVLLEKLTGFAANQEIPLILWNNPKVHYRTLSLS